MVNLRHVVLSPLLLLLYDALFTSGLTAVA